MFKVFRRVALIEGITTLVLFFVAMPAKYIAGQPGLVPPVGWLHGIAFIMYVVLMVPALRGLKVGTLGWLRTLAAAFVPFGTFVNDAWLDRVGASRQEFARASQAP